MRVRYIVVHTAADGRDEGKRDTSAAEIRVWHRARGWNDIGYHYVVRRDGRIEQGRPETTPGAHTRGLNHESLGVCLSGHGDLQPMTEAQEQALISLLARLCKKYNVPVERVIGHREVNRLVEAGVLEPIYRTAKTCPGRLISMTVIRARLQRALSGGK